MSGSLKVAVLGGGVAGLATAFDLEFEAEQIGLPVDVTVFEAAQRPGGHLQTHRVEGYSLEKGPNGFLDSEAETLKLISRVGLNDSLQRSEDATRRRFLLVDGRICELPTTPQAFLASPLLSWPAKLRMAAEFFIPRRRLLETAIRDAAGDETVHDFGCRRLGTHFAEVMLDPMVKGISGGDSKRLSLAAAFPRIAELETHYGSLLRAMISLQRNRKKNPGQGGSAGPSGTLHSFLGGMAELPMALAENLRGELRCASPVKRVEAGPEGFTITSGLDAEERCDGPFAAVVDATPAHAACRHHADDRLCGLLGQIPWASISVVTLAFSREAVEHDLDGFGMLFPSRERRGLLGVLWSASIFKQRAPEGAVLLRCMVGGATDPHAINCDDEDLTNRCLAELGTLLGLRTSPLKKWIFRHERAIAQYDVGHLARLSAIDAILADTPGLFLTGASYRGIAVNHCAADAARTARKVISFLDEQSR